MHRPDFISICGSGNFCDFNDKGTSLNYVTRNFFESYSRTFCNVWRNLRMVPKFDNNFNLILGVLEMNILRVLNVGWRKSELVFRSICMIQSITFWQLLDYWRDWVWYLCLQWIPGTYAHNNLMPRYCLWYSAKFFQIPGTSMRSITIQNLPLIYVLSSKAQSNLIIFMKFGKFANSILKKQFINWHLIITDSYYTKLILEVLWV